MPDETQRDYGSEREFEEDRRRLFREGGWLVREKRDGRAGGQFWFPFELGDLPGAIGCIVLVVGAVAFATWALTRRNRAKVISVEYERPDQA